MDGETLTFGDSERTVLLALVDLSAESDGFPVDVDEIARHLRWPTEFVWCPLNVCCRIGLAYRRSDQAGFHPLVDVANVPAAQPYPRKVRRPGGKLDVKLARNRKERERNAAWSREFLRESRRRRP